MIYYTIVYIEGWTKWVKGLNMRGVLFTFVLGLLWWEDNLFLRFFHIVLVAAYFVCCFGEIIGTLHISTLKERAFTPLKNNFPTRTPYFSAALPKHINTLSKIKVETHSLNYWVDNLPKMPVRTFNCFTTNDDLFKITLESPLNKAPPLTL